MDKFKGIDERFPCVLKLKALAYSYYCYSVHLIIMKGTKAKLSKRFLGVMIRLGIAAIDSKANDDDMLRRAIIRWHVCSVRSLTKFSWKARLLQFPRAFLLLWCNAEIHLKSISRQQSCRNLTMYEKGTK